MSAPVDVLAVLDETIRKTESAMPTPLNRHGESAEHPVHHASRLYDLKQARAAIAELNEEAERQHAEWKIEHAARSKAEAALANVLEIVAKYCGKTSSMYRYIADDLKALQSSEPASRGMDAMVERGCGALRMRWGADSLCEVTTSDVRAVIEAAIKATQP